MNNINVQKYIDSQPDLVREILGKIRTIIDMSAPEAEEGMAYGMPGYKLNGKPLVYFSANKERIGFYPTPSGVENFKKKLGDYKFSKGAIQFPVNKKIPYSLIKEIVDFRVKENKSYQK